MTVLRRFLLEEKGATAVEYGLIVVVLSLTIIGGFGIFADRFQTMLGTDLVETINGN